MQPNSSSQQQQSHYPPQHFSKSPIGSSQGFGPQVSQPQPQRFQDYSPLQSVNLSKYNFDYGGAGAGSGNGIPNDFNKSPLNESHNSGANTQQHRLREAISQESLRIQRHNSMQNESQIGASFHSEMSRLQNFQQQQPIQLTNLAAGNPAQIQNFIQQLQQQQQLQQNQALDQSAQLNPQYVQLILQQQQQLQLMQSLLNQSMQIQQQYQIQQPRTVNPAQSLDLSKVLKHPQVPQLHQQQSVTQANIQQQLLLQQLLQQQQQQLQQNPSHIYSGLQTPLERNQTMPPTPIESSRNFPMMPPQMSSIQPPILPPQHQQFVQSYQQIQDNLNQYRKLATFLEKMEASKKSTKNDSDSSKIMGVSYRTGYEEEASILNGSDFGPKIKKDSSQAILWPSAQNDASHDVSIVASPSNQGPIVNFNKATLNALDQKYQQQIDFAPQRSYVSELEYESKFIDYDASQVQQEANLSGVDQITKESFNESEQQHLQNLHVLSQNSEGNRSQLQIDPDNQNQSHISGNHASNRSMRSQKVNQSSADKSHHTVDDQVLPEEKPIVGNQMTFEQLLETKLQQEHGDSTHYSSSQQRSPKRDFLRKNSTQRGALSSLDPSRPSKQYKYYADNFTNQNSSNNSAILTQNQSPKNFTPSTFKRSQTNEQNSSSSNKRSQFKTIPKSNQKQPKQNNSRASPNAHQMRPQSQQMIQSHPTSSSKQVNSGQKSRQNLNNISVDQSNSGQKSSASKKNHDFSIKAALPKSLLQIPQDNHHEDPNNLVSERNSVIEFEMLEQECIAKYLGGQPDDNSKELKLRNPQPSQEEKKLNPDQQKKLDQKIHELEIEIEKFKIEKSKVTELQHEYEVQLQRITKEIEDFESRKEQELEEIQVWRQEQMEEIERERAMIEKERRDIEEEREFLMMEKTSHEKYLINETERLLQKIKTLESENNDLNKKLDELTDKQYHCKGTQTQPLVKKDQAITTLVTGDVRQVKESISQAVSPLKGILKNSSNSPVKFEDAVISANNQTFNDLSHKVSATSSKRQSTDGLGQYQKPIESCDSPRGEEDYQHDDSLEDEGTQHQQNIQNEQNQHSFSGPRGEDQVDEEDDESDEDEFDLRFPPEYHGKNLKPPLQIDEIVSQDGKIQRFYDNGKKEVIFSNGVRREVWPSGYSIVYFNNNDIKQTFPDQKVVYYFAEARTTQTTFPNGLQVFKFSNNQVEKHFQDGTKEISFPDGTIKCLFPDGEEESIFPDGTIQKIEKSGFRIIEFPNGQRDVLYPDGTKVREYEDGSVKKIHPDGKVEMIQGNKKKVQVNQSHNTQTNKYMVGKKK